jgi:gamma-glutamylcyclotransferase (GGCT)/AIG2-like uncharacterized protein YtfP
MPKVFVYGTLLGDDAGPNYWKRKNICIKSSRHATIKARMYIVTYPYVVLDGKGKVHGKVFDVDETTLKEYDDIEGLGDGWYERRKAMASYDDRTEEEVWVYCFSQQKGGESKENGQFEDWYDKGKYPVPKTKGASHE